MAGVGQVWEPVTLAPEQGGAIDADLQDHTSRYHSVCGHVR